MAGQDKSYVPIVQAIQTLRRELSKAIKSGNHEDLQFQLGPVELELQLVVTRGGSGEAGVQFGVVSGGIEGSVSREATHTVKLTLVPISPTKKNSEQVGTVIVKGEDESDAL